jgi:septin family protein
MNSVDLVANHVKQQHLQWNSYVRTRRNAGLEIDMSLDTRFDICLYFISPHRYRGIDIKYVEALRKYVNVIPLLARSDSMSVEELATFRPTIRNPTSKGGPLEESHTDRSLIPKFFRYCTSLHDHVCTY